MRKGEAAPAAGFDGQIAEGTVAWADVALEAEVQVDAGLLLGLAAAVRLEAVAAGQEPLYAAPGQGLGKALQAVAPKDAGPKSEKPEDKRL